MYLKFVIYVILCNTLVWYYYKQMDIFVKEKKNDETMQKERDLLELDMIVI